MTNVTQGHRKLEADEQHYQIENAPQEAVDYVLAQGVEGRSQWVWIRLPDGELVLAVYPQDDCYFSTEHWRSI